MTTELHAANRPERGADVAEKVTQLRRLLAGAPADAKTAGENVLMGPLNVLRGGEHLFTPALSAPGKER